LPLKEKKEKKKIEKILKNMLTNGVCDSIIKNVSEKRQKYIEK